MYKVVDLMLVNHALSLRWSVAPANCIPLFGNPHSITMSKIQTHIEAGKLLICITDKYRFRFRFVLADDEFPSVSHEMGVPDHIKPHIGCN